MVRDRTGHERRDLRTSSIRGNADDADWLEPICVKKSSDLNGYWMNK